MLTKLRTQMKLILWILVFAFLATIIFSWGMGGFKESGPQPGVLGEINGAAITMENFDNNLRRRQEYLTQSGEEVDSKQLKKLREEVWDDQVEGILKSQNAQTLGITVADREIAYYVENYPPNEVREAEAFQRDGKFDPDAYANFLRDPTAAPFLLQLESSVYNYLYNQKLEFHASQAADVTEEEVMDEYLKNISSGKLRFIAVLNSDHDVDSSEITDKMLRRYYQLFSDRFKSYPQSRFVYVKFSLATSHQDSLDMKNEAEQLLRELRDGADFAELAGTFSQDPSSGKIGGDLGWFDRDKMVKEFTQAAFAAKPGELIGPVGSKFGYHIILVEDHKGKADQDSIKARHILLKVEPSAETRDLVYNEAYSFAQDALERGFDIVANELDYDIDTTKMFSEAGYITGLGRMRMAAEFCFNKGVGAVSGVYPIPNGNVVFKVIDVIEEDVKPFDEVKSRIHKTLENIVQKHKVWDATAELLGRIENPEDMELIAEQAGLIVHETADSLKPTGTLPGDLKSDQDFLTEAFRLEKGEISGVIRGKLGCYIAYMVDKAELDEGIYTASHPSIYQELLSKKSDAVIRNWVRELRIAGDIQDYRYRYFKDF